MDILYYYNTLYKVNDRWLSQGTALMSGFVALGVTLGAATLSIRMKHRSNRTLFAGADMALASQLANVSTGIVMNLAVLEIQMRYSVVMLLII